MVRKSIKASSTNQIEKKKKLNCMIILRDTQNVYLTKFQSYF